MASEVGVKLTGDNSAFRAMLADSSAQAQKFGGEIAGKVGSKLAGLQNVGTALATALGLNLQSIAENIARTFSGMSKAEEEAFKNLETVSDQVTAANIKNMRAVLSEEQRYQLNLQDRDRLVKQIGENEGQNAVQLLKQKKDELALAAKVGELQEHELRLIKEQRAEFAELVKTKLESADKQFAAQLSLMSGDQKILALQESIVAMQTILASGALDEANAKQISVSLAQRQNELISEQAKLEAKREEGASKTRAADAKAGNELAKLRFDLLTTDEKILILAQSIAVAEAGIADGKAKGVSTSQLEVALLENRKELSEIQAGLEGERLRSLEAQVAAVEQQADAYADLMKRVQTFERKGAGYESQSDSALTGVRDRLQSQIAAAERERFGQAGGVGQIGGRAASPMEYGLRQELRNVLKELAERSQVSQYAGRFGEDAARQQFGDSLTDRAMRSLQDSSTRTQIAIEDIQQRLAPVFARR